MVISTSLVSVVRYRLVLLNHFSDLVSSCIGMFGVEKQSTAGAAGSEVSFDGLRCLISPAVKVLRIPGIFRVHTTNALNCLLTVRKMFSRR